MSMSLYFSFKTAAPLAEDYLQDVSRAWNGAYGGKPYESWGWYEPVEENGKFIYDGAIKIPPRMNAAWVAIQLAVDLLSQIRNDIGGSDWTVRLDDHEIPWDESEMYFDPTK